MLTAKSFWQSTRGNATLLFAISAVPILGAVGVAMDSFRSNDVRNNLTTALDGAVLAGAAAFKSHKTRAEEFFDTNFEMDGVTSIKRSFTIADDVIVTGTATAVFSPTLSAVLGYNTMTVTDTAVAEGKLGSGNNTGAKLCILALAANTRQSMLLNSGSEINASSCEVHVSSTASPAAIFNAGTSLDSAKTCIKGNNIIDNGGIHRNLKTGCTTMADPYAGSVPSPASTTCQFNGRTYTGRVTLNPGVYCGWHNFNSGTDVTLNAGTYVIKGGGWNVSSDTWTGNGVTFYYEDTSKIQFNSAVKANLKAPTSGPFEDYLFAEKPNLSNSQVVFDDNRGFDMTGIIHLPSRDVTFNSNSKIHTQKMTAVFNTVIFNEVEWNMVHYDNGKNPGPNEKLVRLIK